MPTFTSRSISTPVGRFRADGPFLRGRSVAVVALAALAAVAVAGTAAAAPGPAPSRGEAHCTSSVPYRAGEDGYDTYRIPATVRTKAGTLLAFAEGRVGGAGDSGNIDVVVRRSTDGGCTWGPLSLVAAGDGDTRGNPAPVVDPRTGKVVLVTSYNSGEVTEAEIMRGEVTPEQSRRVFVQSSADDGRSFTRPRDITADTKLPRWRWYATGPGHAVALTHGPHKGRLVVPANHSTSPPEGSTDTGEEDKYYGAHALYSDDGGRSWQFGFIEDSYEGVINANESAVAQLPDGRLYFSARDQNGSSPGNRLDTYSSDGGESIDRGYEVQPTLADNPVVQGTVLQVTGRGGPLLFAGPSVPTARKSMAIWSSADAGASFGKAVSLSAQPAAYSDLVQPDRRTVGLLYETGVDGPYESIEFRRVPVSELR
ncbi:Sialidase precursor [Streptomyces sp. YIM 130001]|uniref:sialidase family protein n=1 Tax=Streptomyces sp. YIM 130001 TaxID=2259644 RepID=UPI000E65D5A3|nr:sialidase family protein [Streptomyces sp. YIM 130001]RII17217.1 Sialidase precursor [Streptomyces sp. YIM 130001]